MIDRIVKFFLAAALYKLGAEMEASYNHLSTRVSDIEKGIYSDPKSFGPYSNPIEKLTRVRKFEAQRDKAFYLSFQCKELAETLWPPT